MSETTQAQNNQCFTFSLPVDPGLVGISDFVCSPRSTGWTGKYKEASGRDPLRECVDKMKAEMGRTKERVLIKTQVT